jgi:hypothetical protein
VLDKERYVAPVDDENVPAQNDSGRKSTDPTDQSLPIHDTRRARFECQTPADDHERIREKSEVVVKSNLPSTQKIEAMIVELRALDGDGHRSQESEQAILDGNCQRADGHRRT